MLHVCQFMLCMDCESEIKIYYYYYYYMHRCSMRMPLSENMALGQVVTQIVGHVDTVWDMKQVYIRTTLNSKYVTTLIK